MSSDDDMSNDDDIDPVTFGRGSAPISALIGDEPVLVAPSTTLREAARLLCDAGVGLIAVGTVDDVEGVLSERDIVGAVAAGTDLDTGTVAETETKGRLDWATTDSTVAEVAEEMMRDYVRHVLVSDGGKLIGIVSIRDVLAVYVD